MKSELHMFRNQWQPNINYFYTSSFILNLTIKYFKYQLKSVILVN